MSPIKDFARQLLQCDKADLPPDLLDSLKKVAINANKEICKTAGKFLHQLDDTKFTQKQVKSVIEAFPEALSYQIDDKIPIQSAVMNGTGTSLSFIPQLAQEGNLRDVGGQGNRGGLLTNSNPGLPNGPNNTNLLQQLAELTIRKNSDEFDVRCMQVYSRLKKLGLFLKQDIQEYNLLTQASLITSRQRFLFFSNWDPEALRPNNNWNKKILIHAVVLWDPIFHPQNIFEMVLEVGMVHFPIHFGWLFCKDMNRTVCEVACEKFGVKATMNIIHRCIPPSENYPILQHVAKYTPTLMNEFVRHYPDAVNLRDSDERSLFVASLASGSKSFTLDALFFQQATFEQIAEQDPVTNLFPFAIAATEHTSDLDAVFTLLRRDPALISVNKGGIRKRKHVVAKG